MLAEQILPGATIDEAIVHLETDPSRDRRRGRVPGLAAGAAWTRTIVDLDGTHFDIPEPVKRVEAMIAPPGGAAAMYYTGPSEDFSRPGRTWYPTLGKTRFPLWGEVSIGYHEGVPGHHLQIGQVRYLPDSSPASSARSVSGHGEGWALYAERLMDELGYFDHPDLRLGMLARPGDAGGAGDRRHRDAPRAGDPGRRGLPPGRAVDAGARPGVRSTHDVPARLHGQRDRALPRAAGQAISYKVGERVWLEAARRGKARRGDRFDLKTCHRRRSTSAPLASTSSSPSSRSAVDVA